jgi:hypothetical protein
MKKITSIVLALLLCGCAKYGASGYLKQMTGDWAPVRLPPDCKVRQIAGEEGSGVIVLCEDGRVFH